MFGRDNPGFCLSCGDDAEGVEPDAEGHICEGCGAAAVMGKSTRPAKQAGQQCATIHGACATSMQAALSQSPLQNHRRQR